MLKKISKDEIQVDESVYDISNLNMSNVIWHIQGMTHPERFFENMNASYSFPRRLHRVSLSENDNSTLLFVDDKIFRYSKLNESDINEIQDYINKYAYATAILKLNECANILGSGMDYVYTESEQRNYIAESCNILFDNITVSTEKGKLVESFQDKLFIYEGNSNYMRGKSNKRIIENWNNTFDVSKLNDYEFRNILKEDDDKYYIAFNTPDGVYYTLFENVDLNMLSSGVNTSQLLSNADFIDSYKVSSLVEWNQPFTMKEAALLKCTQEGNKIAMLMLDAYGNKGTVYMQTKIPADEFLKKYDNEIKNVFDERTFEDRVEATTSFMKLCSEDIDSVSRVKGLERVASDETRSSLSYKVTGLIPYISDEDLISVSKRNKSRFSVKTVNSEGKLFNLIYDYTGSEPITNAVDELNNIADDYDFSKQSEVISFYQLLSDYGVPFKSYPCGISTKGRRVKGDDIVESEGVQTTDIAPKTDQGSLIKVKMKRKKNDLLINSLDEQDEFYGSRGFVKDNEGRYHFGDYYITESGSIVHKSKLTESNDYNDYCNMVTLSVLNMSHSLSNIVSNESGSNEAREYVKNLVLSCNSADEIASKLNEDSCSNGGRIFGQWKAVKDEHNVVLPVLVNQFSNKKINIKYDTVSTVESNNISGDAVYTLTMYKGGHTEDDLTESEETANEAYDLVNQTSLKLQEVKKFIQEGTEAEKIYDSIMIDLNNLQMTLYNQEK